MSSEIDLEELPVHHPHGVEAVLEDKSQRLQLALTGGGLSDWSWDVATDVVRFGEGGSAIFGVAGPCVRGSELLAMLFEEDRAQVQEAVGQAISKGTDYQTEYRVRRASGEVSWVASRGRAVYTPNHEPVAVIGVIQDITARKMAELVLHRAQQRMLAIFNQGAIGIAVAGLDGKFEEVNRRFAEYLGYTEEELLALTNLDITHPDDCSATEEKLGQLLRGEMQEFSLEKRYVRKSGGVVWSHTRVSLLRDRDGQPAGFIASVEDITDQRAAQIALQRSEAFNRIIVQSIRDSITTLTLAGSLLWMSECAMRMFERDGKVPKLGNNWVNLWNLEFRDAAQQAVASAASGESGNFVAPFLGGGKLPEPRWFDVAVTPILGVTSGRPERLLVVSRNITARRQMEHELEVRERELSLIFQNVNDGIFFLSVDGTGDWWGCLPESAGQWFKYVAVNRTFLATFCLNEKQVVGQTLGAIMPSKRLISHLENYCKAIREKRVVRWEESVVQPEGEWMGWVSVTPLFNAAGVCTNLIGTIQDITHVKLAEYARNRLAAVVENSDDAILAKSLDGIITTWNQGAQRMLEYCAEEIVGKPVAMLSAPGQVNDERVISEKLERGERVDHFETTWVRRDGVLRQVSLSASPIKETSGAIIGISYIARDITDRKQAELELREQSEWFAITLSSITDAVIAVDNDGCITFMNAAAEKLTGFGALASRGRRSSDVLRLIDEVTGNSAPDPMEGVLQGMNAELARSSQLVRNNQAIPIEVSAAPIRSTSGQIIGAVMVFRDVTDRREHERALQASEQRFWLLSQVVPQLLWSADHAGHFEYWNERWYTYTGKKPEQSLGMEWIHSIHPDEQESTRQKWFDAVRSTEQWEHEYRLADAEGLYRWFVGRGVPLRDGHGQVVRWYGSCSDIHQQKLTSEALRVEYTITEQLNEVAKALATELDLSKVVQIITDAGTRITRAQFGAFFHNAVNEQGEAYMLYSLSGVPRSHFDKFPIPRATKLFGPTFRGEGIIRADDITKDPRFGQNSPYFGMPPGHLPVVSYMAVPVISPTGEVIGGLFFGHAEKGVFTERDEKVIVGVAAQAAAAINAARLYAAEQNARSAAERANEAKDHFLAALSHELRTPLTPVLGILEDLAEDPSVAAAHARDLATIRRNVVLEARLIDDLLDLTRIIRGKMELHLQRVNVGQAIEDAINTCLPELQAKGQTLVRSIEDPKLTIIADGARVTQILWNLIKNAIKFTPRGGRITVRSRRISNDDSKATAMGLQGGVCIDVEDTGIGIESEYLEKVFQAFEQGDAKVSRQFGGLGLGLAISKELAGFHHGTLQAYSEGRGCGSCFKLSLPLQSGNLSVGEGSRDNQHRPAPYDLNNSSKGEGPGPLRILLVEDHEDTAAILKRLLERSGHRVFHAPTVQLGLAIANREMLTQEEKGEQEGGVGLDLVMSDLGLPDGTGFDLMREISQRYHLPGIALSGFGMESDFEHSATAGFSAHLVKPLDIATVRRTISEVMTTAHAC